MKWLKCVLVAVVTAATGAIGAGIVASLAVEWYHVSSFEGGSGFFVVGMALVGAVAGFIIGLVASLVMMRRARSLAEALAASAGSVVLILAVIGGASWMLADIPPVIDGEELFLLVETRWPAGVTPQAQGPLQVPHLDFGSLSGDTLRKSETGPLFIDDARLEDGRWIVPGAVPIFTTRGQRLLGLTSGDQSLAAFIVPLPRSPGEQQRRWSQWLPTTPDPRSPAATQYSYRYKVIKRSEPVRSERIGRFEVDTVADYFYTSGSVDQLDARSRFRIRYDGQPVAGLATAATVAALPGGALLITVARPDDNTPCALLIPQDDSVRTERIRGCGTPLTVRALTADPARFAAAHSRRPLQGWVDRASLAAPGLFQLDAAILDTRTLTSATFLFPEDNGPNTAVPPLSLSPDEHSFVWLPVRFGQQPQLSVTNWRTSQLYILPVDPARMRFTTESALTPEWIAHHFEWRHRPDGDDVLVERPEFVPLPYRGELALARPGEYQSYTLRPGSERLRDAMVEVLSRHLGGEAMPDEPAGFRRVRVNGRVLTVTNLGTPEYVNVSMSGDDSDPQAMSAIAAALDAALASGRYDALFVH